jgi:hypothetical protein
MLRWRSLRCVPRWRPDAQCSCLDGQGYTTVLSIVLLFKPVTQTRGVCTHASLSAFALFSALGYRNIWPLLTFVYAPADGASPALWAIVTLAGVTGVFVPLFEPFAYIPFDPAVSVTCVYKLCSVAHASASIRKL